MRFEKIQNTQLTLIQNTPQTEIHKNYTATYTHDKAKSKFSKRTLCVLRKSNKIDAIFSNNPYTTIDNNITQKTNTIHGKIKILKTHIMRFEKTKNTIHKYPTTTQTIQQTTPGYSITTQLQQYTSIEYKSQISHMTKRKFPKRILCVLRKQKIPFINVPLYPE